MILLYEFLGPVLKIVGALGYQHLLVDPRVGKPTELAALLFGVANVSYKVLSWFRNTLCLRKRAVKLS